MRPPRSLTGRLARALVMLALAAGFHGCGSSTGPIATHSLAAEPANPGSARVYFLRPDPGFLPSGGLAGSRAVDVEINGESLLSLARGEYALVHIKPSRVAVTVKAWANDRNMSGGSSLGRPAQTRPFVFSARQTYFIVVRPWARGSLLGPGYAPEAVDLATAQEMAQALTPAGAAVQQPVSAVKLGPLDRIHTAVDRLEAAEVDPRPGPRAPALEAIGSVARELETYLGSNPDDVRALILAARVGRMESLATSIVIRGGPDWKEQTVRAEAEGRQRRARLQAYLDRALIQEPTNAEAFYWKARLHGISGPGLRDDRAVIVVDDLDRVIGSAKRAVDLAPDNVTYREALAIFLVGGQRWAEATTALDPVMGGRHPIALLLRDHEALPLPPGAVFWQEESDRFAELQRTSGTFRTYSDVRTRVYTVPGPVAAVEAFYRDRWPGFQLFPDRKDAGSVYRQHFRPRADRLEPASRPGQFKDDPDDGVALLVAEQRPGGQVRCLLIVLTLRGVTSW